MLLDHGVTTAGPAGTTRRPTATSVVVLNSTHLVLQGAQLWAGGNVLMNGVGVVPPPLPRCSDIAAAAAAGVVRGEQESAAQGNLRPLLQQAVGVEVQLARPLDAEVKVRRVGYLINTLFRCLSGAWSTRKACLCDTPPPWLSLTVDVLYT